jgi:hypothetical protein
MEREDMEALKLSLAEWLRSSPHEELRLLAADTMEQPISIEANQARIGYHWIYDPKAQTVTKYHPPISKSGFNFIYHVKRTSQGWQQVRLEIVEIRYR